MYQAQWFTAVVIIIKENEKADAENVYAFSCVS
jgi:hypothetical protein